MMPAFGLAARLLLLAIFLVAGVAKLRDRERFRQTLVQFGSPSRVVPALVLAVPLVEIVIAGALLVARAAVWAAVAALGLLIAFCLVMGRSLLHGRRPSCQCFGELSDEPIGWWSLVRNVTFMGLAALVLVVEIGTGGADIIAVREFFTVRTALSPGSTSAAGIVIALLGGQAWLIGFLMMRQRALALRLTALEARPAPVAAGLAGLAVGALAPPFTAPMLTGGTESLADLLRPGKPVLLFFFDPDCGPCKSVLPSLAKWQIEHAERLRFVLVGRNMAKIASAPEYAPYHVLYQQDREIAQLFKVPGIPTAVLIGADGRIRSPLAVGPAPIERLVNDFVGQSS